VSRVDASGGVTRVASVFPRPTGVVVLPDGRLVASLIAPPDSGGGALVRIDPVTGTVTPLTR
jgi:hypothetical protein